MLSKAGYRLEGEEWEEILLYAIASNGDFFGTGMMGFSEKQLYKKFFKVIEIHTIARIDVEQIKDIQFYSRFLAIYVSKMKIDWVRIDNEMKGKGMKEAKFNYEIKEIEKCNRRIKKLEEHVKKHPHHDFRVQDGSCLSSKEVYKEEIRRRFNFIQ
jgi:hypothetical protein